jgi:hypothetical protein
VERPRPEVTVTDPRRPGPFVAVQEPPPPRLGRPGGALLAAAAVACAAALFGADVVRDRRLDGVVDVALGGPGGGWSSSHDPSAGTGTVEGVVRLLNRGPRDVRVTSARLGALRYAGVAVLPAGDGSAALPLRRTVRCPGDGSAPPTQAEPQELRVRLATPAGPREVSLGGDGLPTGSFDDSVQSACAYPPLRHTVRLAGTVVRLEGRAAVLRVELTNEGRRPVRLLSVVPARGLGVLSIDGDPARLPVVLPAPTGRPTVRTLEVRLGVICGALLGADLLAPFEKFSAIVEDGDRSAITSVSATARDPDVQLRQLARRTCSSG